LNIIICIVSKYLRDDRLQQRREWLKKFVQQGRSLFDLRSVLSVRENGKMGKAPLAAFFNIPLNTVEEKENMVDSRAE